MESSLQGQGSAACSQLSSSCWKEGSGSPHFHPEPWNCPWLFCGSCNQGGGSALSSPTSVCAAPLQSDVYQAVCSLQIGQDSGAGEDRAAWGGW